MGSPTDRWQRPPRVARAEAAARDRGFALGCRPEVGALLRSVVASKPGGRIAESGTGVGIGTAWMQDGLGADAHLVTVEHDRPLADFAATLFADDPRIEVLSGDWTLLTGRAPFDVFFCDGGGKADAPDRVIDLLAPGGLLVLDDFTPSTQWPPSYRGAVDELRLTYLTDSRLVSSELQVAPDMSVVLGVRRDPR